MVMKRIIVIAAIVVATIATAAAQTTGYVNTETILSRIPEYVQAQQQLERLSKQYETQLANEVKVIEDLFARYQAERAQLNEVQRQARENDIISKERVVKQKQQDIFGQEGVMSNKSKELLDPIREYVQNAINEVARETGTLMIFDVAAMQGVIYRDPRADLTPKVLNKLGIN